MWEFSPVNHKWKQLSPNPTNPTATLNEPLPRSGAAIVHLQNKVIIFGGVATNKTVLDDLHVFDMGTSLWSGPMTPQGTAPEARSNAAFHVFNASHVLLYGGRTGSAWELFEEWYQWVLLADDRNKLLTSAFLLNVESMDWTQMDIQGHVKPNPAMNVALGAEFGTEHQVLLAV